MLLLSLALSALATPAQPTTELEWFGGSYTEALGTADAQEKNVCIYFWSNASEQCARMYQETIGAESVVAALGDVVLFSANTADDAGYKLVERYNVRSLPTVLFVKPSGELEDAVVGYIGAQGFVEELKRVGHGKDTISDFRQRASAAPEDIETLYAFSVKLADCGDEQGAKQVTEKMKRLDPHGETLTVARLLLSQVQEPIVAAVKTGESGTDADFDFSKVDVSPLEEFIASTKHAEIKFDGWNWISEVRRMGADHPAARKAAMRAWEFADDERASWYGRKLARAFYEQRDELSSKEKKFALKVALASHKATVASIEEKLAQASKAEGCASAKGCATDEGCGGCGGAQAQVAFYEAEALEAVACAYFLNGKRSKAFEALERGLALAPESEGLKTRLASFKAH